MPGFTEDEVLRLAASLDQGSEHPLADAIVAEARRRGLAHSTAGGFESGSGIGVRGTVDGKPVALGNTVIMKDVGVDAAPLAEVAEANRSEGASVVYVAADGQLTGLIAVADPIKDSTPEAIRTLRAAGIRIVMATGDGRRGMMMGGPRRADLKKADADSQVVSFAHCRDTYTVKTASGETHRIWEFPKARAGGIRAIRGLGLTRRMVSSGGDPMVFIPMKDAQEAQFLKDNDAIVSERARTAANRPSTALAYPVCWRQSRPPKPAATTSTPCWYAGHRVSSEAHPLEHGCQEALKAA